MDVGCHVSPNVSQQPTCCTQYPGFPSIGFPPQETLSSCEMDGSNICSRPSSHFPVCPAEEEKDQTIARGWEINSIQIVLHMSAAEKSED